MTAITNYVLFFFLLSASLVFAGIDDIVVRILPNCAESCAEPSILATHCTNNQVDCLCKDSTGFLPTYYDCLTNGGFCNSTDQVLAINATYWICSDAEVILPNDPWQKFDTVNGNGNSAEASPTTEAPEVVTSYTVTTSTYVTAVTTTGLCVPEAKLIVVHELEERDEATTTVYTTLIETVTRTLYNQEPTVTMNALQEQTSTAEIELPPLTTGADCTTILKVTRTKSSTVPYTYSLSGSDSKATTTISLPNETTTSTTTPTLTETGAAALTYGKSPFALVVLSVLMVVVL